MKMTRRVEFIIWLLVLILVFELTILYALIYFAKFESFLLFFTSGLRIISPFLLWFNIVFLLFSIFTKGIEFTAGFWRAYFREYLKFVIISLSLALFLISISAVMGVLTGITLEKVYSFSSLREFFTHLRIWVNKQFY